MPQDVMIETVDPAAREDLEEFHRDHQADTDLIEEQNLSGLEVLILVVKVGPPVITAVAWLVKKLRDKNKRYTVTIDGIKYENISKEELEELLDTRS